MRESRLILGIAVLSVCLLGSGNAFAQPQNTCESVDALIASLDDPDLSALVALLGDTLDLLSAFSCDVADFNGGPPPEGQDLPLPNGMLDGAFEFGVLDELINNPSLYTGLASGTLTGQVKAGITVSGPTGVAAVNTANYTNMGTNLLQPFLQNLLIAFINSELAKQTPPLPPLTEVQKGKIVALLSNLIRFVSQYATLGDDDSMATVVWLANLVNNAIKLKIDLIPVAGYSNTTPPGALGPQGDADGDGYTNWQEYVAFAGAKNAAAYVEAALDPQIVPSGTEGEGEGEGEGEASVEIRGRGMVEETGRLELRAVASVTPLSYQWAYMAPGGSQFDDIDNEQGPSLIIEPVALGNEGYYQVTITYDDGAKAIVEATSSSFFVDVVPEGTLPIAGGLGISLLAGVCAFAGAVSLRRKK